jgi:hypothetical protein
LYSVLNCHPETTYDPPCRRCGSRITN